MKLVYDKPASGLALAPELKSWVSAENDRWQQTVLPLGGGDLACGIYGETDLETIIINEKTLWTGGKTSRSDADDYGNILGADEYGKTRSDYYYEIQKVLKKKRYGKAERLFKKHLTGDTGVYGTYLCWGDVFLEFGHTDVTDYSRRLDLDTAVASVEYTHDGTRYTRSFFVSNTDNLIVIKLTAEGANKLNFKAKFTPRPQLNATSAVPNVLPKTKSVAHTGTLSNGLKYYAGLSASCDGVMNDYGTDGIAVTDATEAVLLVAAVTDYENKFPEYRTGQNADELKTAVEDALSAGVKKGYEQLLSRHTADYGALYSRMSLTLANDNKTALQTTTDALLDAYRGGTATPIQERYLEELLFAYGRYLLIACSRENSKLPANLQGVWNASHNPPWNSDYHLNVNLQMNYWPACVANLAECLNPLTDYVDGLRGPGRLTAKVYTGTAEETAAGVKDCDYGFLAHTQGTPFGYTGPGENGWQKAQWSPAAVAWLLQNVYEKYEFTLDKTYLVRIYPIMSEAVRYFERTLTESGGRLVSSPVFSPEHGPLTEGNTYEQSLIWQLYSDTVNAAEILGLDADKSESRRETLARLKPIEIGADGQIKEWYQEKKIGSLKWYPEGAPHIWKGFEKTHRHVSHLLGLYPGKIVSARAEYLAAAKVSLNARGDAGTGWAMGHKLNLWARVGDGDRAHKLIKNLISRGIYKNLWDAHPPFQIDGNFGYTAGVAEMLIQSEQGSIKILPALPKAWQNGQVHGLLARGGFSLNFEWEDMLVTALEITSAKDATPQLLVNGKTYTPKLRANETLSLNI